MRLADLKKQPALPSLKPATYTECLQAKLEVQLKVSQTPKFTPYEIAIMEGGHSVESTALKQ